MNVSALLDPPSRLPLCLAALLRKAWVCNRLQHEWACDATRLPELVDRTGATSKAAEGGGGERFTLAGKQKWDSGLWLALMPMFCEK